MRGRGSKSPQRFSASCSTSRFFGRPPHMEASGGTSCLSQPAPLLAVVLVEAAFLIAVPVAATVATAFALSKGVFARIFPLAPASGSYLGLGAVLLTSRVLPRAASLSSWRASWAI